MRSFISEDDIEQAICNRLSQPEYGWKRIECDPSVEKQDDVGATGRYSVSECILPEVLRKALIRINPQVDKEIIDKIVSDYRRDYSGTDMVDTNYRLYNQLRNGIKVDTRKAHGDDFEIVKLIDFDNPQNNDFHCVNQMWIKGHYRYRRPDVLLFVNGLPLVFIELKNSTVKIEESYNKKFAPISYLHGLSCNDIDDEKLERAKARMADTLDQSVSSDDKVNDDADYVIHQGKVIDLSKLDIDAVRKEIKVSPYKALEIEDLRVFIEKLLEQLINKNCTRIAFSERYKSIINRYNAGGSENEDYYEKLLQLIEEMKKEQSRSTDLGLEEEELEIYDLLIQGRKLTKSEEQKVILASKNLYKKLIAERDRVMVVDWYKDEQPRKKVLSLIQVSLNNDLPESYDRLTFNDKTNLLLNHFIDMAVQGYGWVAA